MRKIAMGLCGLTAAILAFSLGAVTAKAGTISGTLFYTTFSGGENVWKVNYSFNGTTFSLTGITGVAATNGADGILFAPDGNLLIAGQGSNLTEVTTGGAIVSTVNPGGPSFHLALTSKSSNALVYNMWNGSGNTPISAVTLSAGGLSSNGVAYTVTAPGCPTCSTDVRGVIFDPVNNTWYYGTAPDGGSGDFGTVVFDNTAHTATLTRLATGMWSHGLSFDPFTNDIITNSGGTIQQFDPLTGLVVSSLTGLGNFDQASEDGKGDLFVASNSGYLEFVDYASTGLIGASGNFVTEPFLAGSLDDIAPLSGSGGQTPEPSSYLLLGGGLAALIFLRSRRSRTV